MLRALLAFAVFSLVVIFSFTLLVMVMAEFMMNQEFFLRGGCFCFCFFPSKHRNWFSLTALTASTVILSKREELSEINDSCLFNCSKQEMIVENLGDSSLKDDIRTDRTYKEEIKDVKGQTSLQCQKHQHRNLNLLLPLEVKVQAETAKKNRNLFPIVKS